MCDCFQLIPEPEPDYRYWKYCEKCGSELKRGYLWDQGELRVYKYDPITRKPTYTWFIQCPNYKEPFDRHTVYFIQTIEINDIKLLTTEDIPF